MLVRNISISVLFFFVVLLGIAQSGNNYIPENVLLTTDRTIYFSGEQILLKINCLLPVKNDSLSRVVYVELLDKKSKPILQKKLPVLNGIATAAIPISEDVITGNYYLRAYTQYMRNLEVSQLYTSELMIINPELPSREGIQTVVDSARIFNKEKEMVEINPAAGSFISNSLAELTLKGKGTANVSVSVVKKGSYEPLAVGICKNAPTATTPFEKLDWYPEIRSVSISGKIVDRLTNQPLKNIFVYASVVDSVKQFHVVRTNEEGFFIFSLTNLHENHQVYICAEVESTILVNSDFAIGLPVMHYNEMKIDSAKSVVLNDMYENAQVSNLFNEELVSEKRYLDTIPDPFRSSGETIYLKDYIALPLFADYFNEIIPYTRIKTRKEGASIQLVDRRTKEFFENPLVLVDNIPFHNHAAVLSIVPSKIESVKVIASKFVFGREVLNGVVLIKTKEGNIGGLPLPPEVVSVDYITYEPLVTISTQKQDEFSVEKPGLKNTLYWEPSLNLTGGQQTIKFYCGNAAADYDVIVRGVDEEGNEFTQVNTITVKNK